MGIIRGQKRKATCNHSWQRIEAQGGSRRSKPPAKLMNDSCESPPPRNVDVSGGVIFMHIASDFDCLFFFQASDSISGFPKLHVVGHTCATMAVVGIRQSRRRSLPFAAPIVSTLIRIKFKFVCMLALPVFRRSRSLSLLLHEFPYEDRAFGETAGFAASGNVPAPFLEARLRQ